MPEHGGEKKSKRGGNHGNGPSFGTLIVIVVVALIIVVILFLAYQRNVGEGKVVQDSGITKSSVWSELWTATKNGWRTKATPVFIVLDVLLFGLFIFSLIKVWPYRPHLSIFTRHPRKKTKARGGRVLKHRWQAILKKSAMGTADANRIAVIEADTLVNSFLKAAGYEGDHLADRLSQIIPGEVKSLERLWVAHRLRNESVHTPGFVATQKETKEALDAFEAFLKELNAL